MPYDWAFVLVDMRASAKAEEVKRSHSFGSRVISVASYSWYTASELLCSLFCGYRVLWLPGFVGTGFCGLLAHYA